MDSDDWRHAQAASDDQPAGRRAWSREASPAGGQSAPAPDLWAEDPNNAWGVAPTWIPEQRDREGSDAARGRAGDAGDHAGDAARGGDDPGAWYRLPEPTPPPPSPPIYPPASDWGQGRHSISPPLDPSAVPTSAVPMSPFADSAMPAPASRGPSSPASVGRASRGRTARAGVGAWSQQQPATRPSVTGEDDHVPRRRDEFGEEPVYGPVLGFTAGWFAIPALFYLIWLVTLDANRRAIAGHQLVTSLPWLFAAVVLALAVAGLLRWAVVGWRALTISFAAAVIGAGVTTIAHSLTI